MRNIGAASIMILCSTILISSCGSTAVISANSEPAKMATRQLGPKEILDIGIITFDPNINEDLAESDETPIVKDVRRAESRFIAYHLKDTLEQTGNWGAVRVLPNSTESSHLEIKGKILLSDGEMLRLSILAQDSTGKIWLEKEFEDRATGLGYENPIEDPFQDLYNDISNELLMGRERNSLKELENIRTVAELKFATDLAPERFSGYLKQDAYNRYEINQLPAYDDPMVERVTRLQDLNFLFIDTLDTHFNRFYQETKPSYDEWRRRTFDEALRLRELETSARRRIAAGALMIAGGIAAEGSSGAAAYTGAIGGITAIRQGMTRRLMAENQVEILREMSQSLASEITPYVLDIEGKTVQIAGTAEQQFIEWKSLLRKIYAEETSIP